MLAKVPLLICHQIMCCANFASEVYLHCGCGLTWPFHLHSPVCQLFLDKAMSQSSKKQTCCMFWLTLRILILVFFFLMLCLLRIKRYIIISTLWSKDEVDSFERKSPPTVQSTAQSSEKGQLFCVVPAPWKNEHCNLWCSIA